MVARIYALYERSKQVLVLLAIVAIAVIVVACVRLR